MAVRLVDPRNERLPETARAAPRLSSLPGCTVALVDISKPGGSVFLDRIERLLTIQAGVRRIERETKPTFAKLAPDALIEQLRHVDAVVLALAD
jgi:hypothetical protein